MDIAKDVFQLHGVEMSSGTIERHKLRRSQVMEFFAQREPLVVAIEACASAHEWARRLGKLGRQVKLIAPRSVRPFVLRNKTDAADARAIWTAVQQPEARLVAIKSEAQQAILALHRVRAQLMKFRIMQTNGLRGVYASYTRMLPANVRGASDSGLWPALRTGPEALHASLGSVFAAQRATTTA